MLDTDYDFPIIEDCSTTTVSQNIGSVWRDMVVEEQMEGCLTRLEVTTKTNGYTDMDNPNYAPSYVYRHFVFKFIKCLNLHRESINNVCEIATVKSIVFFSPIYCILVKLIFITIIAL